MLDDASLAYLAAIHNNDHAETERLARVLDIATTLDQAHRAADLAAAALDYARADIPVFPIKPRGKQPLTAHGFKDATTSLDTVADWWAQWPDANIGVPTGIAFDVVDIDGAEGIATMYNGEQALIDTLDVLAAARTSRPGGRHLYVPVSGRGNKTSVYPGVDYRGAGGYVVAPPSIGANGTPYQWVTPLLTTQAQAA